jgi:signal peptidase I
MDWRTDPSEEDFIKRVIGVAGDHVACDAQDRVVVNGMPLDEPYLYHDGADADPACEGEFEAVVPEGRLWVMGDHRTHSGDSRERFKQTNGDIERSTIAVDDVVGRAFVLFWPFSRATWLTVPSTFDNVPAPPGE